jgi:hypothetical protein
MIIDSLISYNVKELKLHKTLRFLRNIIRKRF